MTNKILNRLGKMYDSTCIRTAGVVGTGIHLYSLGINNEHFQGICEDFANAQYLRGALKATVPYILPYCVSLYARKKAKKEVQEKINGLERTIEQMEK